MCGVSVLGWLCSLFANLAWDVLPHTGVAFDVEYVAWWLISNDDVTYFPFFLSLFCFLLEWLQFSKRSERVSRSFCFLYTSCCASIGFSTVTCIGACGGRL